MYKRLWACLALYMHDKYLLMEDLCLNVLALLAGEI